MIDVKKLALSIVIALQKDLQMSAWAQAHPKAFEDLLLLDAQMTGGILRILNIEDKVEQLEEIMASDPVVSLQQDIEKLLMKAYKLSIEQLLSLAGSSVSPFIQAIMDTAAEDVTMVGDVDTQN